ncbi:Asp-tRNA(Asn)/Glu-tRNA(Gln) amidotransferase subunit GatC [Sulfurimonas sp.]|uniref:Asp-tRNA(Asn)/Glu-tRNA(Gln) amidotransferase subunit GatC n=1 Tax=Sulfurimonas sp. TaxID=2022749 RepID=UPI002625F4F3|nr:Asp-tRNA(Asn)/Glu-tRNA(Gln) amidotransferase subunit GatC [Sulfurimonas sp.]MDD5156753.1 Asp-tRNA(Asn)/Glu-tRNA(Gln) amidotransferase subunit GatC [Sulfurimonas sp.]
MQVDDALLTKLEKLSFLKISDDKREQIITQLSEIVNFVDNLSELNTNEIDSKFAVGNEATHLREDTVQLDGTINENILKNAPLSQDNFFIVPKIIE